MLIDQLKINKACKNVDVPTKFMKYGKSVTAQFLYELYNKCIVEGEYRDIFMLTEVIPKSKKENSELASNYRPISLNYQFNVIFEKPTYSRMYAYLEKYDLVNERQFGFRSNHSTTHAMSNIYEELLKIMMTNYAVAVCFLIFQKRLIQLTTKY